MEFKNLILKRNNYGYNQEVVNEVLEYKTSGKIPDYVKGKNVFKINGNRSMCLKMVI